MGAGIDHNYERSIVNVEPTEEEEEEEEEEKEEEEEEEEDEEEPILNSRIQEEVDSMYDTFIRNTNRHNRISYNQYFIPEIMLEIDPRDDIVPNVRLDMSHTFESVSEFIEALCPYFSNSFPRHTFEKRWHTV